MTKEELIRILDKQKLYEVDERGRLIEYSKDSTNPSRIYIDLFNLVMDLGDISVDGITAQPEREKGHWILGEIETGAFNIQYQWKKCSKCGWESSLVIPRNFCPKCGADMRQDILEDDTPTMFATAFRGGDLTEEEESALDHLFDMMTAVKQQVLLRKALHFEKRIPYIDWKDFFAERGEQDG